MLTKRFVKISIMLLLLLWLIITFFIYKYANHLYLPSIVILCIVSATGFKILYDHTARLQRWVDILSGYIGQIIADSNSLLFMISIRRHSSIAVQRYLLKTILIYDMKRKHEKCFLLITEIKELEDIKYISNLQYSAYKNIGSYSQANLDIPNNLNLIPLEDLWMLLYQAVSTPHLGLESKLLILSKIFDKNKGLHFDDNDRKYMIKNIDAGKELIIAPGTIPLELLQLIELTQYLRIFDPEKHSKILNLLENKR